MIVCDYSSAEGIRACYLKKSFTRRIWVTYFALPPLQEDPGIRSARLKALEGGEGSGAGASAAGGSAKKAQRRKDPSRLRGRAPSQVILLRACSVCLLALLRVKLT